MTVQMYSSSFIIALYKTNMDVLYILHMEFDSPTHVMKTMVLLFNALLECSSV